jgi:hypothetical protein
MTAASAIVAFKDTPVLEGDGWATLVPAYRAGFTSGASDGAIVEAIVKANDIAYTTNAIENWIFGMSGRRLPFSTRDNPGMHGGPKNVGYAFFRAGNVIKLPDIPRAGLPAAPAEPLPDMPPASPPSRGLIYAGAAALLGLLFIVGGKKKKKTDA